MRNGAPFPLQRRSDLFRTYGGVEIRELMIEEITARRMPLAPVTIEDAQRDTLLAWLKAGAPPIAPSTCIDAGSDAEAGDGSGGGDGGDDAGTDASTGAEDANDDDASPDEGALLFDGGDDQ